MTARKAAGRATKKCSKETSGNRTIDTKLKRPTTTISASEVNRYTYCHYQWYYERLYGRAELGRLYRHSNKEFSPKSTAESNFARGRRYHEEEYARYCRKQVVSMRIFILVVILCAICYYLVMYKM